MKPDHVAGAFPTKLRQPPHRIFIECALFRQRILSGDEKRRVHRPPSHNQVHQHAGNRLIVKAAAYRKEELLAPFSFSEQRRRDDIHVEKGPMIRHQHDGTRMIDCLDMLETVDSYQVITRDMNPAGAEKTLTPGPETFPATKVHAMRDAKGETLEGRENGEFVGGW